MKHSILFLAILLYVTSVSAQQNAEQNRFSMFNFKGDFMFRGEQDWNSRKPDGLYRANRSRLRFRLRYGFTVNIDKNFELSAGVRTGNIEDQQVSHVTLGGKPGAFGLVNIGIEKAFLKYKNNNFQVWAGKHKYPFWKQNELLWNNNVFPEGIALGFKDSGNKAVSFSPFLGYFMLKSSGTSFGFDSYLTSAQIKFTANFKHKQNVVINLGDLYFNNIPEIPDNKSGNRKNYNIIISSLQYNFYKWKQKISIGGDFLLNTINYRYPEQIPGYMSGQQKGYVFNFKLGELKEKNNFIFHFYYADISAYAVVDYLAQNDFGRWDYSSQNVSAGRLSNFRGFEFRAGYSISKNVNVVARYYHITQKLKNGAFAENGDRFRIDINARF